MSALINCSLITIHYIIERRYCAYLPRLKSRVSRTNFNEKCKQMYDYVLFSYILDYSCFPFLLPTSTLVFRYFNLEVIALTSSFGIFSDVASPAIIL